MVSLNGAMPQGGEEMAQINNMLTDAERWKLNKWLENIGNDVAWVLTAPQLADRYERETGNHVTSGNLQHSRRVVYPRQKHSNNLSKLHELEKRIEVLEREWSHIPNK